MASLVQLAHAAVELLDEGSGPAVLLLHGFPTTRLLWRAVVPALAGAGLRAVAPDLVGYGAAPAGAVARLDMAGQAEAMLQLLDRLGIDRVLLAAHDVGTAAAQLLTARAPERVRALVLIDGVFRDQWAMESLASILSWPPAEAARLFRVLVRTVRGSAETGRLDEQAVREVLAPFEGEEGGLRILRAARALDPRQTADVLPALAACGVPIHVLWGSADRFLPAETVGRPLAEALGAQLELIAGGHFLPLERPAELASSILRFFAQRARP